MAGVVLGDAAAAFGGSDGGSEAVPQSIHCSSMPPVSFL